MNESVQLLPVARLQVHPLNPRKDVGDVTELAESIRAGGLIEPIIVVANDAGWYVVAGSRRLAAAKTAQLEAVPAIVRDYAEHDIAAAAAIENLQRKDLTPIEEAEAYREILRSTGWTQEQLGKRIGRAQSTIANALRLLKAPAFIKEALRGKGLTAAHARVLLQVKDPAQYDSIAQDLGARAEKVTVDELQDLVNDSNESFNITGPGAAAAAKAFLEDARGKHPKATITWKAATNWSEKQVVDLVVALGEPPAPLAGPLRDSDKRVDQYSDEARWPTATAHKKHCGCDAYQLVAESHYGATHRQRVRFRLRRACVVSKNYREAKPPAPKRRSHSSTFVEPKPPTAAQIAKQEAKERERIAKEIDRALTVPKLTGAAATVLGKLRKAQIPADAGRALIAAVAAFDLYDDEQMAVPMWERLRKMPAKKVSELAVGYIARQLDDEAFRRDLRRGTLGGEVAAHFGVKVPAARPEKKKAKR